MIRQFLPSRCGLCAFGRRPPTEADYVRWQTTYRHVPCDQHKGRQMPRPR